MKTCKEVLEQLMANTIEDDSKVLKDWVTEILEYIADNTEVVEVDREYNSRTGGHDPVMGIDKESITDVIKLL